MVNSHAWAVAGWSADVRRKRNGVGIVYDALLCRAGEAPGPLVE